MSEDTKAAKSVGWIFKTLFILAILSTFLITAVAGGVYWYFSKDLPRIITVEDYRPLGVTRVLANSAEGEVVIGEFYKERRYVTPTERIPDLVIKAFISAEDDQFFEHSGINLAAILRASVANFRAGHVVQGGSTITQQVAKSLLLTPERSLNRKVKEAILASRIEKNLTKEQILYLYLNQIYLGAGSYGVQAAAKTYFNKDVSEVTAAEAAILAGMPQAPGKYSPHLSPKKAKARQRYVLRRMYENKFLTHAQMKEAVDQPLPIYYGEDLNKKHAAYLVEHVRRYALEKYGEKALYEDGLTIKLPVDVALTHASRKAVQEGLRDVDRRAGWRGPLRHIAKAEMDAYVTGQRLKLIERKLGYRLLLPNGTLDILEAMTYAGIQTDSGLLDKGEIYEALVTAVSDKAKTATVQIGGAKAEIPLEQMSWAKPAGPGWKPEPRVPSQVLKPGDVVLARILELSDEKTVASLEQEPQAQAALFSIDVKTGNVLALEGGFDFEKSEFNRATQAQRQIGSAFKPIIYGAALGKGFTPASIIVDSPIVYEDAEYGKWKPTNFEEKFYGDTTFRQALIKSRNVPTIKIVQALSVPFLIDYSRTLGFTSPINADLSISLGSLSASLEELTRVYALYPRLGKRVTPTYITRIQDRDGKVLEEHLPPAAATSDVERDVSSQPVPEATPVAGLLEGEARQVHIPSYPTPEDPDRLMDPRVAYVMTHLMKEVVTHGTGARARGLGRIAAGKTGTTNDYLDAWFMGFTPDVVTGVWVGYDNLQPIGAGETGSRAALPIWLTFMQEAVKQYPESEFPVPPGVVFANIHPGSGKLAAPNSPDAIQEAFIQGTEPTETVEPAQSKANSQTEFFKEDIE